jgi:hypothetical protein
VRGFGCGDFTGHGPHQTAAPNHGLDDQRINYGPVGSRLSARIKAGDYAEFLRRAERLHGIKPAGRSQPCIIAL